MVRCPVSGINPAECPRGCAFASRNRPRHRRRSRDGHASSCPGGFEKTGFPRVVRIEEGQEFACGQAAPTLRALPGPALGCCTSLIDGRYDLSILSTLPSVLPSSTTIISQSPTDLGKHRGYRAVDRVGFIVKGKNNGESRHNLPLRAARKQIARRTVRPGKRRYDLPTSRAGLSPAVCPTTSVILHCNITMMQQKSGRKAHVRHHQPSWLDSHGSILAEQMMETSETAAKKAAYIHSNDTGPAPLDTTRSAKAAAPTKANLRDTADKPRGVEIAQEQRRRLIEAADQHDQRRGRHCLRPARRCSARAAGRRSLDRKTARPDAGTALAATQSAVTSDRPRRAFGISPARSRRLMRGRKISASVRVPAMARRQTFMTLSNITSAGPTPRSAVTTA